MSLQDTDKKKLQKKGEVDSMAWQSYAVEKLPVLESVTQDMVQQKDKLPNQLLEVANVVLMTSSGVKSLKDLKKDFERLLAEVSTLVVIVWQLYIGLKVKYHSLGWPPPKLKNFLEELVDMACLIHELLLRKSEKNLAKRVLLGCFGIRDLGKFNKYQRRLGIMALFLQSKPHNINIPAVLSAVVHSRTQPQDEDSDSGLAGELVQGDLPDEKSAKKKAADRKPTAKGSRLCEVEISTSVTPANQRAKSEEDSQRKSKKAKVEAEDNSKHQCDEEHSTEDKPVKRRMDRRTNGNEESRENQDRGQTMRQEPDEVEPTSAQGPRSSNVARSKIRKKINQAYEDEEIIRDTAPKQKSKSRTIPVTPQTRHQVTTPVTNRSGIVINENIGNIYNLTTWE